MTRQDKIKQTQRNVCVAKGLQIYGYELSLLLKIIENQIGKQYVGIEEIETMILIHTLAFEKILKISIIAVDCDVSKKKLREISHSIKKCFDYLITSIKNEDLTTAVNNEISNNNFRVFIDILDELATIERRYDKLDSALEEQKRKNGIIDDKIDKIYPHYMENNKQSEEEVLKYIYINTLTFIYIIELILGEVSGSSNQQSLVSLFEVKYELTIFCRTIDQKFEVLQQRKLTWENLLI